MRRPRSRAATAPTMPQPAPPGHHRVPARLELHGPPGAAALRHHLQGEDPLMSTATEPSTTSRTALREPTAGHPALDGLLRAELHQLASTLGVPGAARLRKGELVDAITAKRATAPPATNPRPAGAAGTRTSPDAPSQRPPAGRRPHQAASTAKSDLVPAAGILDIRNDHAFLRTSGYQAGPDDLYVSLAQVRTFALRPGDVLTGATRAPGNGDRRPALAHIDTVNGRAADQAHDRPDFTKLTPLHPQQRLSLETDPGQLNGRIIDLIAPIGKGQRALIVAPPKTGKTMIMQAVADAITRNHPEAHLMVVLVDERPEEVTDMQRSVKGEVIASTFDRPARDHITVAELAIERAKRLVELGHDVVVLLDSITRLARAYNTAAPTSGRTLTGGLDSAAIYRPKKFFGAARNIENGGSLTIVATALVDTGSRMDDLIFEEFKSTGNMELRLDRRLADKRIFPAVDVQASGTRREELLLGPARTSATWTLRRVLSGLDTQQAMELLQDRLKKTLSNTDFLGQVTATRPNTG
ncbi:transcription termination factor Rho [Kitasatospora indigofera]|uniref:transcription termination factor Rho n=2 Tax=Kitasatospora indigofera TaxID=67307 RepID=UPI0036AE0D49